MDKTKLNRSITNLKIEEMQLEFVVEKITLCEIPTGKMAFRGKDNTLCNSIW